MKSLFYLILLVFLIIVGPAHGSNEAVWSEANNAYDNNDFESAVAGYRALLERGIRKPEIYYNLGGAYFKNNQIGMAIAAYRHCLKIDPSFASAKENLDYVRGFTIDKVEGKPKGFLLNIWYGLAGMMSAESFFILTIVSFWSLVLSITSLLLGYGKKEFLTYLLIVLALVFILGAVITNFAIDETVNTKWGVITVVSAELKEGPGEDFEKIFTGHEGLEFKIISKRQGYFLVELANGLKGWIKGAVLTEI